MLLTFLLCVRSRFVVRPASLYIVSSAGSYLTDATPLGSRLASASKKQWAERGDLRQPPLPLPLLPRRRCDDDNNGQRRRPTTPDDARRRRTPAGRGGSAAIAAAAAAAVLLLLPLLLHRPVGQRRPKGRCSFGCYYYYFLLPLLLPLQLPRQPFACLSALAGRGARSAASLQGLAADRAG